MIQNYIHQYYTSYNVYIDFYWDCIQFVFTACGQNIIRNYYRYSLRFSQNVGILPSLFQDPTKIHQYFSDCTLITIKRNKWALQESLRKISFNLIHNSLALTDSILMNENSILESHSCCSIVFWSLDVMY